MQNGQPKNAQELLELWLQCNSNCKPAGTFQGLHGHKMTPEDLYEFLISNLPAANYVADNVVNLIFSNGLTTGNDEEDKILDAFLYAKNRRGVTNYDVLKAAIKDAIIFGKCGIRKLSKKDGIVLVPSKNYASVIVNDPEYYGLEKTEAYVVAKKKHKKIWEIDLTKFDYDVDIYQQYGILGDKNLDVFLISPEELLNLRNDISRENGRSQLSYDQQRIELIINVMKRLNYDIEYDGMGRVVLHMADGTSNVDTQVSTGEILNTTDESQSKAVLRLKKEAAGVAADMQTAGSEAVVVLSNAFDKNITLLPRVTKATEFLDYFSNENLGDIMSQIFGVASVLINLGQQNGNISMEAVIDNAMLNNIVPIREKFAVQISGFLADWIGVEKIYFDKYQLTQAIDENVKRKEVADIIKVLIDSSRVLNEQDRQEEALTLIDTAIKFGMMLTNDIEIDGVLEKLGAAVKGTNAELIHAVNTYMKEKEKENKHANESK